MKSPIMRTSSLIPWLVPMALLIQACSGSKPMSKRAGKLDQAGLYAEAAEMYLGALVRNGRNVDATIGLKRTGQQVLNDHLSEFFKHLNTGADKAATVDAYLRATNYQDRVQRTGVRLEIPDHYRTDFEKVKGEHLVDLYDQGQSLLEQGDYGGAESLFARISKLEPGYKDASSLQRVAFLEPLYQAGMADLQAGNYRKAYDEFGRVIAKDPTYKDAFTLQQEAVNNGRFIVAVLPFTSSAQQADQAIRAQAHAMTALTSTGDPFLRVVDRENMERILEEQRLSLSGMVDEQTAVRVGNLMGAQAVLMGTVIDYREQPGQMRKSLKQGYESYNVSSVNKETGEKVIEVRYRPAQYTEHFQENIVGITISYRVVDLETGEILLSKVEEREAKDHVYFATSQTATDRLFPSRNGIVDVRASARRDMQTLFSAPREMRSIATLSTDALRAATTAMAGAVQQTISTRTR